MNQSKFTSFVNDQHEAGWEIVLQVVRDNQVDDFSYYLKVPYTETPEDYQLWLPGVLGGKFVTAWLVNGQLKSYSALPLRSEENL